MHVRPETSHDQPAIRLIVANAFGTLEEARLVDDLRQEGDLAVSLVAVAGEEICGYVALSRMRSPPFALALAPLAVAPARQRQGVGRMLVDAALVAARERAANVVFVLGDPGYYARFGFSHETAALYLSRYAGPNYMAVNLSHRPLKTGIAIHAAAFDALS